MNRKEVIHNLIQVITFELLEFIKEKEVNFPERWVPTDYIKRELSLNFVSVPRENKQYCEKGWFFAILARILEDKGFIEYQKKGSRAFCRSAQ